MTEILYLDLLFLVNLFEDLYLLLLTGLLLQEPLKGNLGRTLFASAVGAGMGCALIFVPKLPLFSRSVLELALPAVCMTRIAFGPVGKAQSLRRILTLWMITVLTGGMLTVMESTWSMTPWSIRTLVPFTGITGLLAAGGVLFLKREHQLRSNLYEVTLHYRGKHMQIRALRDTGNRLYEPYGHQPVHILERQVFLKYGEPVTEVIYIPFCSVGAEHGLLEAVHMDRMEVWQHGTEIRVLERPWVAVSETPLSPKKRYEMLLHGEALL